MKCPACGSPNEDGALFCDQCKSDLDMPTVLPQTRPTPMSEEDTADHNPVPITLSEVAPSEAPAVAPAALPATPASEALPPSIGIYEPEPVAPTMAMGPAPNAATEQPASTVVVGKPRLVVIRGMKIDMQYPLYPGKNYLGRTDDKPVDIDLDDQESPDRIWCSRQHAVVNLEDGQITVEDLNSLNGSFVNRTRVYPGQVKELRENDVLQIGTVHMKLLIS